MSRLVETSDAGIGSLRASNHTRRSETLPKTNSNTRRGLMTITATVMGIWMGPSLPIRLNWTGSAPLGLYLTERGALIARDDVVEFCLGGTAATLACRRGYLMAGGCSNGTSPLLKQVVAVAGDEVELQRDFFAVNGRVVDQTRRHSTDSVGRPLEPVPFGRRLVRDGEVWVLGVCRERSWDSRYFGPVPVASIVAKARPLLTVWAGEPK